MTLLNLLILLLIKPLLLLGFGWWQFRDSQVAAASSRHLGLLLILLCLPLSSWLGADFLGFLPAVSAQLTLGSGLDQWLAQPISQWLQTPLALWALGIYLAGVFWVLFLPGPGCVQPLATREGGAATPAVAVAGGRFVSHLGGVAVSALQSKQPAGGGRRYR